MRFAAGVLGDPWTLVLLRDLLFKDRRHFREFLTQEGPATNVLADRLANLEAAGIIVRRRDAEKGNQVIYTLTEKGVSLVPAFLALIDWSATHDPETDAPASFITAYRADPVAFSKKIISQIKTA